MPKKSLTTQEAIDILRNSTFLHDQAEGHMMVQLADSPLSWLAQSHSPVLRAQGLQANRDMARQLADGLATKCGFPASDIAVDGMGKTLHIPERHGESVERELSLYQSHVPSSMANLPWMKPASHVARVLQEREQQRDQGMGLS